MTRLPVLPPMPEMRCDAGCDECCTEAVPVSEAELARVLLYANERGLEPSLHLARPETCPWFQGGRCAVHEARPLICDAFGHHPRMQCARGYNADVDDPRALEGVLREKGPPTRFLHEVLGDGELRWTLRVADGVWEGVEDARRREGLPSLPRLEDWPPPALAAALGRTGT